MAEVFVRLFTSTNPIQKSIVEEILSGAEISFKTVESPAPSVILGAANPMEYWEFRVPAARLQDAKDVLCANGVVCEVSDRLLKRSLDEIVKPLVGAPERNYSRFLHCVEVNNKETLSALFQATMEWERGTELLEDFFFVLAREGLPQLRILARAAGKSASEKFMDRFRAEVASGDKETRIALLEVLPEFPASRWQGETLAGGLLDADGEVRDAASEALFTLGYEDHGYDPEDPPAEREAAVEKLLDSMEFP